MTLGLLLAATAVAQPARGPITQTPPPRNAEGRAILGSVPGNVGSWEGFGTRPMLTFFDEVPKGSIIAHTPYEDVLRMQDTFPKIKFSEVPFQPWARALFEARSRTRFEPYTRCKPSAGPREVATAYGTQFVEFPEMQKIYIFPTGGPRHFREIWMDGRSHPENLKPSYHGHSIGHWEGDTLVVDTVGFNEKMWFDAEGSPHTDQLHLIERFTRLSQERLQYEITIDDPGAYTQPWSSGFYMDWSSGESFQFVCQDQNMAYDLMLGTEYQNMDRSQPIFP
ncbi:MAG TPA: hypothetical protein VNR18_10895 [Hyphomicrobiales bacterium]|nr:hypothetical protein [Hyphomicrobiales bacterium]